MAPGNQEHPTPGVPATVGLRTAVARTGVTQANGPPHAFDGATRGERDGATRDERDGASGGEGDGATRLAESHPASSWSHDWLQLSHELRTPLNAILGNIELLLDGSAGPLAAPARACIGDIQAASRQLLDQLQPLLLLVQARTSGALATRMPLDLLALIRQASADAACDRDPGLSQRSDGLDRGVACLRDPACLPEPASLMVLGDPIWLGVLAAALVDLHAASPRAGGPLSITLEPPGSGTGSVVLRAFWAGLDPAKTSPIPLALIDAVLALHGGRLRGFCGDGLRLDLPIAVAAPDGSDRRRP